MDVPDAIEEQFSPETLRAWRTLSKQIRSFILNYVKSFNAKQAALDAGFTKTSARNAYRNLKKKNVRLVLLALGMKDLPPVRDTPPPKSPKAGATPLIADVVAAVKEIKDELAFSRGTVQWIRYRLEEEAICAPESSSRVRALENLAEFEGMYESRDKSAQTHTVGIVIVPAKSPTAGHVEPRSVIESTAHRIEHVEPDVLEDEDVPVFRVHAVA